MERDSINALMEKTEQWILPELENVFTSEEAEDITVKAALYSLYAGGKRLRPLMMYLTSDLLKLDFDIDADVKYFAATLEMLHTYSLIHDDLPAMDNDDYRRGRLTNHKMFDEATAILAGDGLLNLAFETASLAMTKENDIDVLKRMVQANEVLSRKAGIKGMIGGQIVDLEMEHKKDVSLDTLLFIHKCKTAALIEASLMIGAIMAGADKDGISKIEKAGYNTGLAFQIQDDILDVTGDFKTLGKSVGSDEKNEKITYVSLKGLKDSEEEQKRLSEEAVEIVKEIGGGVSFLSDLIESLITRNS